MNRVASPHAAALGTGIVALAGIGLATVAVVVVLAPGAALPMLLPALMLLALIAFMLPLRLAVASPLAAVWLMAVLFATIDFTLRPESPLGTPSLDPQTMMKAFIYGSAMLFGVVQMRHAHFRDAGIIFFAGYVGLAALSAVYSPTPLLAVSGAVTLGAMLFGAALLARGTPAEAAKAWRLVFWSAALLALGSLVLYAIVPQLAIAGNVSGAGRLRGLTGAPNSLGPIAAIGLLVGWFVVLPSSRGGRRFLVLLGLAALLLALLFTQSRAAMGALFAGWVACLLLARPLAGIGALLVGGFVMLAVGFGWFDPDSLFGSLASRISRSGRASEVFSATGRLDIWRFSVDAWAERPWLGHGLGSPREIIGEGWASQWGQRTGSAHNFVLESLISFGLAGTLLLVSTLLLVLQRFVRWVWSRAAAEPDARRIAECGIALTVFLLLSGMFEKSFAGMPAPATVVLALLLASAAMLSARRSFGP